jgi:hypothetical protein
MMGNWIGKCALGLMLTVGGATALPAQTSAVNNPARKFMTPDQARRGTHNKYYKAFDNRRQIDPIYTSEIHEQADVIAKCIARRGGDKAGSYLGGQLVGDPDYAHIGEALNGRLKRCAESESAAPAIAISGALAEELLAEKAPHFEDRAVGVSEETARKFFGDLTGAVTIDSIAGCLAVYSPGLAYKAVQSKSGSDEEAAALDTLYSQTPECGLSKTPSQIPVLYQRGALATALYKWTTTQS